MSTLAKRTFRLVVGVVGACAIAGCTTATSSADHAQADRIRADLTPELDTLYQRPDDVYNALTIMADENGRMFMQDLGRAFYTDRPSRLAREPIPW